LGYIRIAIGSKMQLGERIGRRIKLQDLHILMMVVQAGSMRKAATLLNTSQPAISRSIAELEDAIGVRLLDRNPQGIEPTAYGRALLDGGATAFDELQQAVKNIEFLADPTAGDVRIGSIIPLASFVAAVVDRLSRLYPRIVFHIEAAQAETLRRVLSERDVDLLIAPRLNLLTDEQFGFETLYDHTFVVVAGANSPWAKRRKIELAELMDEPWALPPPDRALGPVYREGFRAAGLDYPRTTVVTVSPEVRISLLATGRFLTIFPAAVLEFPTRRAELTALSVELPVAPVPVGIVTLNNRTLSPVARLFIEHARVVAKPLAIRKR
jgi:DNA-binding transcriptional LysR family regulator